MSRLEQMCFMLLLLGMTPPIFIIGPVAVIVVVVVSACWTMYHNDTWDPVLLYLVPISVTSIPEIKESSSFDNWQGPQRGEKDM
eukprot:scaffold39903_cov49-Attheya_sp.AAC.2